MRNQQYPHRLFLNYAQIVQDINSVPRPTLEECVLVNSTMRKAQDLEALVWFIPTLRFCIDLEALFRMAKPDFNLIDYRMSDNELEAFDVWSKGKVPSLPALMAEFAVLGYKVSFTHVSSSQSWCISVTGTKDAKFNSGATLTTWSEDCEEAFYMAWFKVSEIFQKGVWKTKTQARRG